MARAATWGRIRRSEISRLRLSSALDTAPNWASSRRLYSVFRGRLFTGQTKLKDAFTCLYLLWLFGFNVHSDNCLFKAHLALWIEWSLCRNPGSPRIIISTPGFTAPFPLHYIVDSFKNWFWRHLVEGDVIDVNLSFLLFTSKIR